MAPPLTTEALAHQFAREGAFQALRNNVESGAISAETASQWTAQIFGVFHSKVDEAKKEVHHLQQALHRLDHVTLRGTRPRPYQLQDPLVMQLAHEATTFDDWVVSLMETDLTMIFLGAPGRARAKPQELAKAMATLTQKRIDELKFTLKAPELFASYRG